MEEVKQLKSELGEDNSRVGAFSIKVEDMKFSEANVPINILSKTSLAISTDKLSNPLNMPITDYNLCNMYDNYYKCIKQENMDTEKTKIKEEIIEDDENEDIQRNDNMDNVNEEQGVLNIKISNIKSENIVCNNDNRNLNFSSFSKTNNKYVIEHSQIHHDKENNDVVKSEKSQLNPSQFVCNYCGYSCTQKSLLTTHMRCHAKKKKPQREIYEKHLTTRASKTQKCNSDESTVAVNGRTYNKEANNLPYSCGKCYFITKKKKILINHLRAHAPDFTRPFRCITCGYKCNKQSSLVYHHKNRIDAKPYACKVCNYKTCIKYHFTMHNWRHTGTLPFACDFCDYKCSQLSHLIRHKRTHTGERPFSCSYCDYRCNDKSHLTAHNMKHTGERPYTCDYCDYRSITKANLIIHVRKHTGEKPYECAHCEYKGITKARLIIHIRKHSGQKSYACTECEYTTCDKACLIEHLKQHRIEEQKQVRPSMRTYSRNNVDKKPFSCNYCEFRCLYASSLAHHEKIHTGQKP